MNFQKFRVFLFGSYINNAGPDNVNRNLIENCQYELLYTKTKGKIIKRLEWIFNLLRCDVVVFSGLKSNFWMAMAGIFNKKTIYLMHGCISYETRINKLQVEEKILDYEKEFLKSVDLILPVSEQYKNWVLAQFPEFKNKTHYLNSGIVGGG